MPKPRLLVMVDLDMAPEALDIIAEVAEVDYRPADYDVLKSIIGDYDAYFGHVDTPVDKDVLASADKLRVVTSPSTGTDHLDKEELARRGIELLTITRDYDLLDTFTATAELAWLLLLACCRHFPQATRTVREGHWRAERFCGTQLSGKTLGILGYGRLGKMSGRFGNGFGMRVLACDLKPIEAEGVEQVDFDTLLRESDAITIHVHLTPENYHLISTDQFARMKDGVFLINTSRGDIIDEEALLAALASGKVAAAGLDVIHDEWREDSRESPLVQYALEHDNLIITPHIGGCTHTSIADARIFAAQKLADFLRGLAM